MSIPSAIKSPWIFSVLASAVAVSLLLPAGFISVSVIVLTIYSLVCIGSPIEYFGKFKILYLPILFFVVYGVWSFLAESPSQALNELVKKGPILLLSLAFIAIDDSLIKGTIRKVSIALVAACIVVSIICYVQALINTIESGSFTTDTLDRRYYYFSNLYLTSTVGIMPIYLSLVFNMAFLLSISVKLFESRWIRIVISVYLAIFVVLIASKSGVLTLFVIVCVWLLFKISRGIVRFIVIAAVLAGSAGSIFFLPFLKERFITSMQFDYEETHGHRWNSNTHRMAIWLCAWEASRRNPVVGYGTTDGQKALEEIYKERKFHWGLQEAYNPHCEFFTTHLDTGVVGLLALLASLIVPLVKALRSRDLLMVGFILIVGGTFLIESALLRQRGIVFFAFFYGFLYRISFHDKNSLTPG